MGVRSRLSPSVPVVFWFLFCVCSFVVTAARGQEDVTVTLCDVPGCNCTYRVQWKTVNCTLDDDQDVHIKPNSVPYEMVEIFISGGRSLLLDSKSFNELPGLSLLRAVGTKDIVIESRSFFNIACPSLLIQIENCDQLTIKTGAFNSAQNTVEVEISYVSSVLFEKAVFSKLQFGKFSHIDNFTLGEGTFEFESQVVHRHGPATKLLFNSTVIQEILPNTFASALDEVTFYNSHIGNFHPNAFKARQLTTVTMINSTIGHLMTGAFNSETYIQIFVIERCKISVIESNAILAAITKLTVEHSKITDIMPGAVNATVATTLITGNQVFNFAPSALVLNNWNKIIFDQNIIVNLGKDFLVGSPSAGNTLEVFFVDNDIQRLESGALSFISQLPVGILTLSDNFFNETCRCDTEKWMMELMNDTAHNGYMIDTAFCVVNDLLARCFELQQGLMNIKNFTELVCDLSDSVKCEHYNGETKIVNSTGQIFSEEGDSRKTGWFVLLITTIGLAIMAVVATFLVLILKGGRWLKRSAYLRNMQYSQNERSTDEENTIVTIDESENHLEVPEELTFEFLQQLRKRLDDPNTKEEATEMIERLYEMFIVEDNYENNNRQDEEAHLYEELGNLQQHLQQIEDEPPPEKFQNYDGPMSILKLMEERFNLQISDNNQETRPALVGEYSEPSDAAVHLYTELQQSKDDLSNVNSDTLKSSNSGRMASRPLPDKPKDDLDYSAGPSYKT